MIRLRVQTPDGKTSEYTIGKDSFVIGRSSHADLPLADPTLSREHARLFQKANDWFVEDLGSRNGTFLGTDRLREPVPLSPGQTLRLGDSTLILERTADVVRSADGDGTVYRSARELLDLTTQVPPEGRAYGEESLRRYAERLKMVFEVQQNLARSESEDELLNQMLERVFEHLKPQQGAVFLKTSSGEYRLAANRSAVAGDGEFVLSRSLIREVAEKGMAAMSLDVRTDARFADAASMMAMGVRSLVAAPLLGPEGSLGMIALCSKASSRTFHEEDMELLVSLASVAALRLRNLVLASEGAERKRLQAEMDLARRIQLALLPDDLPELTGYQIHAGSVPSRVTSGDFYEVVQRAEGRECVFFLADVAGKGLSAALVMGALEALAAGPLESRLAPAESFAQISRRLFVRTPPEKYATAIMCDLDLETGKVTYANAGHNPALLMRADGEAEWLGATGTPLGVMAADEFTEEQVVLAEGDLLVLYTDGITEATDPGEEEFGRQRLEAVIRDHRQFLPREISLALENELLVFTAGTPFPDDRTILIVKRQP